MGAATHNTNITVTIFLSALALAGADFSIVMLLVPQASNSLNGARTMTFVSYEEAQTARTAGYISAATLLAAEAAFAQPESPTSFKVGRVDLVGGETYATGLAAVIESDPDFYGVALTPRTDAEIVLVSDYVESASKKMLFFFQSDDAAILTATPPAGLTITDNERTVAVYHTSDAEWAEIAAAVNRLVADPDLIATPWNGYPVDGIDALSPVPTATQRQYAIDNHYNLGLPLGPEDYVMDPGETITGRQVGEMLSADWFSTRLEERIGLLITSRAARHEKIPVTADGLELLAAEVTGLLQEGVAAAHFNSFTVSPQAVTDADKAARRLRITVTAEVTISGRIFNFSVYFNT